MIDITKTDTTIYIGDFAIHQPVTVFTDFIIAVMCFYFYLQLNRRGINDDSSVNWKRFFLFLSLSSFFGGCSHGFFAIHEGAGYKFFWLGMQALNVLSVYYAQQATLYSALKHSDKKQFWNLSYKIQLILFFVAIFVLQNFLVAIIDIAAGLIPIMIIHFIDAKKVKESSWIAYGILVSFLSAIVNASKFSLSAYFNYQDIAHVFFMISLTLMFIGIKRKVVSTLLP